jgi:hypothetical protein
VLPEGSAGGAGGAELWQLRRSAYGKLKVQRQAPLVPDEDGEERPIERRMREAAELLQAEIFPTKYDASNCKFCGFRVQCPAWTSDGVIS